MRASIITALLTAAAVACTGSAYGLTTLYSAQFSQVNGSGAYGQAFMIVDNGTLFVHLDLNGFEADQHHPITIQSSFMRNLQVPPLADLNGDGLIDRSEAAHVTGGTILSLVSTPQANPGYNPDPAAYVQAPTQGFFEFSQTYTFNLADPAQAEAWQQMPNLEMRTMEIYGLTINGHYIGDMPAAIALIAPAVYVPPPTIPEPSSLTLIGLAAAGLMMKMR